MKVLDVVDAASRAVQANPSRPATAILHDTDQARMVVFRLAPGQQVAEHTSTSSVSLVTISGTGVVSGAEGEHPVKVGDLATFAPGEPHGMRAEADTLVLLAVITPRPGARP